SAPDRAARPYPEPDAVAVPRHSLGARDVRADVVALDPSIGVEPGNDSNSVAGDDVARGRRRSADGDGAAAGDAGTISQRARPGDIGPDQVPLDHTTGASDTGLIAGDEVARARGRAADGAIPGDHPVPGPTDPRVPVPERLGPGHVRADEVSLHGIARSPVLDAALIEVQYRRRVPVAGDDVPGIRRCSADDRVG